MPIGSSLSDLGLRDAAGKFLLIRRLRLSPREGPSPAAFFAAVFLAFLLAGLLLGAGAAWVFVTYDLPSIEILPLLFDPQNGQLLQPTRLYDRHGRLLQELSPQPGLRRYVPLQELPPVLPAAVLLSQDPTFWQHSGFQIQRLGAPELHPTLAQQLVADFLLYDEPPTLRRALRERLLAFQVTARFGRQRVLEWYLNSADFGQNLIGIGAAAPFYLGQSASELSPAAAILLASLLQNPQVNPHTLPVETRERALALLQRLRDRGMLDEPQAQHIEQELRALSFTPAGVPAQHSAFLRFALEQANTSFSLNRLRKGGWKLYTTLDGDLQSQAECLAQRFTERLAAQPEPIPCPQAPPLPTLPPGAYVGLPSLALVILDVPSGEVLAAMGETFQGKESPFWASHPSGSILDPFVYLTAFTRGWSPASLIWDLPPQDEAGEGYLGPMRMRRAMANALLRPTQSLRRDLGEISIEHTLSLLDLSEGQVTLLQVATAYATLARSGVYRSPQALLRLEREDHALWMPSPDRGKALIDPAVTYLVNHVLSDVVARRDTWGDPGILEIGRPLAVAIGRTADEKQAWLVVYTPQRLIALWLGSMSGERVAPQWLGILARPLLEASLRTLPTEDWMLPPGVVQVEVCDPSGLLPSPICPQRVMEVFLSGNVPQEVDMLYRRYRINRETGLLATVFTPPPLVEERIYLEVPPQARRWAEAHGWAQPPATYDPIRLPPPLPWARILQPSAFERVHGRVIVRGTAAGEHFRSYRLLIGKGLDPQEWQTIASAETPRIEDVLAEWETQGLEGAYILQLQVLRQDGTLDITSIPVTVSGE